MIEIDRRFFARLSEIAESDASEPVEVAPTSTGSVGAWRTGAPPSVTRGGHTERGKVAGRSVMRGDMKKDYAFVCRFRVTQG